MTEREREKKKKNSFGGFGNWLWRWVGWNGRVSTTTSPPPIKVAKGTNLN